VRSALERVQGACAELSAAGSAIRYVGSILLPVEEACFCRFDSDRPETVAEANKRAELPFARITPGLAIAPGGDARAGADGPVSERGGGPEESSPPSTYT
jgi:hypothetical protein